MSTVPPDSAHAATGVRMTSGATVIGAFPFGRFRAAAILLAVLGGLFVTLVCQPSDLPGAAMAMLLVVAPIALAGVVLLAGRGRPWAATVLVVMLMLATDVSLRQRSLLDTSLDPQNIVKLAIWLCGLAAALMNRHVLLDRLREPAVAWVAALAAWSTLTAVYSPIPAYTFGAGVSMLAMVLFGAVARATVSEATLLKASLVALCVLTWSALAMYAWAPGRGMALMEGGSVLRLAGPFGSPNNLGRAAAIALLTTGWLLVRRVASPAHPLVVASVIGAAATLYLSQSRTAVLALMFAGLFVLTLRRFRIVWLLAGIAATFGLAALLIDFQIGDMLSKLSRTGRAYEITSLTGRTDIWSFVWGEIMDSPLFGYGFASTKHLIPLGYRTAWGWTSASAHNMWLQTWVTTGLVGLVLTLGALRAQFVRALASRDLLGLSLLGFILMFGLTEPGPSGPAPNLLTLVWALWLCPPLSAAPTPTPAEAGR